MWAAAHIATGAILAESTKGERWYIRYPSMIFAGFFLHLWMDSVPFTHTTHFINQHPTWIQVVIYAVSILLVGVLALFNWRAVILGAIFGWMICDIERLWRGHTLHDTLDHLAGVPYGGVWIELLWTASLLVIALPLRRKLFRGRY